MKNFFEFIGFSATALLAGFLVFSYVGKQKNASAPSASLLTEMNSEQEDSEQPRMKTISGKKSKGAAASDNERVSAAPSPRNTPAAPADANVEEKLRTLLDNRSIVESLAAKWKQPVANAADENTNKAAALLAHAIIQSYLGVYTARDLQRDAVAHAGDQVKSPENAAKGYPYAWSVGKLMSRYNLQQLYPAAAGAHGRCQSGHAPRHGRKRQQPGRCQNQQTRRPNPARRSGCPRDGRQRERFFQLVGPATLSRCRNQKESRKAIQVADDGHAD